MVCFAVRSADSDSSSAPAGEQAVKILMLNHNVAWRSTFFRAFYLGRELALRGHQVSVATISPDRIARPRISEREGVEIIETPDLGVGLARTGWDLWDSAWRISRFSRGGFDVVHGFDCRPVVLAPSLALQLSGTPWVSDWADWWGRGGAISERTSWVGRVAFAPFETALEERFRQFASQVTVTSRLLEERARGLGLRSDRVHYLPSGANVRGIPVLDRAESRRELGLAVDAPWACFVGFVQYDLELVIRAFHVARRQVPQARLLLVGPRNAAATALIESLGLRDAVVDVGTQPFERVPLHMAAADVLLLPLSDNLMNRARGPIKLGDYLAAGRLVLSNPVGDARETLAATRGGEMTAADPESYGAGMARALGALPETAARGLEARRHAVEQLDWARATPQLEAIYDRARAGF